MKTLTLTCSEDDTEVTMKFAVRPEESWRGKQARLLAAFLSAQGFVVNREDLGWDYESEE